MMNLLCNDILKIPTSKKVFVNAKKFMKKIKKSLQYVVVHSIVSIHFHAPRKSTYVINSKVKLVIFEIRKALQNQSISKVKKNLFVQ